MMTLLPVLPLLIPLLTATLSLAAMKSPVLQRGITLVGTGALLLCGVWLLVVVDAHEFLVVQVGHWPAPAGISLVVDRLGAIMVAVTGFIAFCTAIYAQADMRDRRESPFFHPLLQVMLLGVCGAFLTGDLFNLYVWFEVMLMASFVLLTLGGGRGRLAGGLTYLVLNVVASALFLAATGLLYGRFGTLNLADLARRITAAEPTGLVTVPAMLLLVAFGLKAGVFPLFFWLPASYHTPPATISAVFAGLLTKVGVYALLRMFTLVFTDRSALDFPALILVVSGLTMVTGVLGAAAQFDIRRVLSFHIISQIGYMTMGLGLFTSAAVAGAVFYLVHHIIVKANLFFISGVIEHLEGSGDLGRIGGLYRRRPLLAILFLVPALSLAGIPPLSGFFAKFAVIRAGLAIGSWTIAGVALLVGLLTLYSMTKIWAEAFWKPAPDPVTATGAPAMRRAGVWRLMPVGLLAAGTLVIGFFPEPVMALAGRTAEQLMDPGRYIRAVLGG